MALQATLDDCNPMHAIVPMCISVTPPTSPRHFLYRAVSSCRFWLGCLFVVLGLIFSVQGFPWSSLSAPSQMAAIRHVTPLTKPIEQIRVGDRVLADNPVDEEVESLGFEVDPPTWRKITLRAAKLDGSWADVVLLRPQTWLDAGSTRVGGIAIIVVPECGISGRAEVMEIAPCPKISPPVGRRYRTVTGSFRHHAVNVVDLLLEDYASAIGTTANHPFWSEDRQTFVRADELHTYERLRDLSGTPRVLKIASRPEKTTVYNLEVNGTHTYHVTSRGVLVHNATPLPPPGGTAPQGAFGNLIYQLSQMASQGFTPVEIQLALQQGVAQIRTISQQAGFGPVVSNYYATAAGGWDVFAGRPPTPGGPAPAVAINSSTGAVLVGSTANVRPGPNGQLYLYNFKAPKPPRTCPP